MFAWLTAKKNNVTTTKYIEYINSIHHMCYSFYHVCWFKFYCDVITRSRLQLIINTLEQGRAMMVERKLDGAVDESSVDESSADQEVLKSDTIVHNLLKIWRPSPITEPGLTAGWLAYEIWARLEILKACYR